MIQNPWCGALYYKKKMKKKYPQTKKHDSYTK